MRRFGSEGKSGRNGHGAGNDDRGYPIHIRRGIPSFPIAMAIHSPLMPRLAPEAAGSIAIVSSASIAFERPADAAHRPGLSRIDDLQGSRHPMDWS